MKAIQHLLVCLCVTMWAGIQDGLAQSRTLLRGAPPCASFPDTTIDVDSDTFSVPLFITCRGSVTKLKNYTLSMSFDSTVVKFVGCGINRTITESWGKPLVQTIGKSDTVTVRVGHADLTVPIECLELNLAQPLIYFRFIPRGPAGTKTTLRFSLFEIVDCTGRFEEAQTTDGSITLIKRPKVGALQLRVDPAVAIPGSRNNQLAIRLRNDSTAVCALQFTLRFGPEIQPSPQLLTSPRTSGWQLRANLIADSLKVIFYHPDGDSLTPGNAPIATIFFNVDASAQFGDTSFVRFSSATLGDCQARRLAGVDLVDGYVFFGLKGDLNADGLITIADLVLLEDIVLGLRTPSAYQSWAGDLNDDKLLDILDIFLLNQLIGPGSANLYLAYGDRYIGSKNIVALEEPAWPVSLKPGGKWLGLYLRLTFSEAMASLPELTSAHPNLRIRAAWHDNIIDVLIYAQDSREFAGGPEPLLTLALLEGQSAGAISVVQKIPATSHALAKTTSAETIAKSGTGLVFLGSHPNPFNAQTVIVFELAEAGEVTLEVFDLLGRKVRTLVQETVAAGEHDLVWDGTNEQGAALPSGRYYLRARLNQESKTVLMALLK